MFSKVLCCRIDEDDAYSKDIRANDLATTVLAQDGTITKKCQREANGMIVHKYTNSPKLCGHGKVFVVYKMEPERNRPGHGAPYLYLGGTI